MRPYKRQAFYYETDQMGIIHHSNYIKWFEEARIEAMKQVNLSYREMEEADVISPVLAVNCEYKSMIRFDDIVYIHVAFSQYDGVRYQIQYSVENEDGSKCYAKGTSDHCFINRDIRVISLKKTLPDFHEKFMEIISSQE